MITEEDNQKKKERQQKSISKQQIQAISKQQTQQAGRQAGRQNKKLRKRYENLGSGELYGRREDNYYKVNETKQKSYHRITVSLSGADFSRITVSPYLSLSTFTRSEIQEAWECRRAWEMQERRRAIEKIFWEEKAREKKLE